MPKLFGKKSQPADLRRQALDNLVKAQAYLINAKKSVRYSIARLRSYSQGSEVRQMEEALNALDWLLDWALLKVQTLITIGLVNWREVAMVMNVVKKVMQDYSYLDPRIEEEISGAEESLSRAWMSIEPSLPEGFSDRDLMSIDEEAKKVIREAESVARSRGSTSTLASQQ